MRVGIRGSGPTGGMLGTILARAGHDLVFSDARGEQKLRKLARDAQGSARHGTPAEAARSMEPFGPLIGPLAYEGDRDPELAYRCDGSE